MVDANGRNTEVQVYYNSACPVCDLGVNIQKKKMARCNVGWKDINSDTAWALEVGSDIEFIRERLHVVDENQQLRVGVDAFIALWEASPSEHWKAYLVSRPVIYSASCFAYNTGAYLLYRWNRRQKRW